MATIKARKVGNSVTVTLPKDLQVETGQEFIIEKGRNGVILLAPKINNPFDGNDDLGMEDDFADLRLLDNEF